MEGNAVKKGRKKYFLSSKVSLIVIFATFIIFSLLFISGLFFGSGAASDEQNKEVWTKLENLRKKIFDVGKQKGFKNLDVQDVFREMDPELLGMLKKYYLDYGCPLPAKSFEECASKIFEEYKKLLVQNENLLKAFQGKSTEQYWVCPVNPDIKDETLCYEEVKKQLVLLPVLALLKDAQLKDKNWTLSPRIFKKEVPSTGTLAVQGVACGITSGNLPDVGNWAVHFVGQAFDKAVTGLYPIQSWIGASLNNPPGECSPTSSPNCGVTQSLNTAQGEFYGLLQWLAEQLEQNLLKSDIVLMIQRALCGKGTCIGASGVTLCLVVKDNSSANGGADSGYRCYADTIRPSLSNDAAVIYFNRAVVQVIPDPLRGYLTAIIALWANDFDPGMPLPSGGTYRPGPHNTIDGTPPSSELCVEARTCSDGITFDHRDRGARIYMEGVLLRIRLQPVIQGSLVDVCVVDSDIDILGTDIDHPVLGCLTNCLDFEPTLESSLKDIISSAVNGFIHGDCPIPGVPGKTDKDFSLCPKGVEGMPGTPPGGPNCSSSLPLWNCSWNSAKSTMECTCPELGGGGGGGCKHAFFPIDLNEVAALGARSFSVAQYCGRDPITPEDPPSGHAHEDDQKCYPGPMNYSFLTLPKRPWYGTMGCGSGVYDVGCYTNPSRLILTGTGCSMSFDVGIRPKDLSGTCTQFTGAGNNPTVMYTDTSGFFPRPAFSRNNYAPFPLPDNALYWSWLSGVDPTLTTMTISGNRDEGYAQTGIFTSGSFYFYNGEGGGVYTNLCANTNGYIALPQGNTGCTTPDNTPDPIPSASSPNTYIAPLWADLSGDDNEFLYYQVTLPPLFVRIQNQTQPPGCVGCNGRPETLMGWTGSSLYYHRVINGYETICNSTIDFNNGTVLPVLQNGVFVYDGLPFNFPFYTQTANTRLCIDNNGAIYPRTTAQPCPGTSGPTANLPDPAAPNGVIAALWKDLDPAHISAGDNGGMDCDGSCPRCGDGCIGACTTTADGVSWFCHQPGEQSCNPGWTYCPGGCTNCGTQRWCKNWDAINDDVCCGSNGDCCSTCYSNGVCSGNDCYTVPGCRCPDNNCRIGPCDGDTCNCNQRTQHCHGTCLGVCPACTCTGFGTTCDVRCDSTGGAGGCAVQNQCCFWRNGGWECACASNQTCQGGCGSGQQQRRFRVLGMGYVMAGGFSVAVDCPGADLANGIFDDDNDGIYYEDDDPSAPNCQAIIITYYKITDYDYVNDNGCGNRDEDDCPGGGTDEDCCSDYICSGGDCQWCGACDSDNRELCRLRQAGIINPDPSYGNTSGAGNCSSKNTFQVVLFSDGTIDINLENWSRTDIVIDPDGPGGSGCNLCLPCITNCDCAPKTNLRPFLVGIEDYNGTVGIRINNPLNNVTYRFIRAGRADTACGPASMRTAQRTDCPDTLQPGVAPNRTCRIVKWDNWHVKGQAICIDMYAILYNVGTGVNTANDYDIVFFYENFKSPLPGITNPADQARAARLVQFTRTIGVENGTGTLGQYGYLPPDGTGIVMRYSPAWTYWIGLGISQDAFTDIAHMFYSSGWMCLAINPGGAYSPDSNKFNDIGAFLPIGSFTDVSSLQYFFPAVRYLCDPDGKAEIRFIPQGGEAASARTGTSWPSLLTPDAPGSGSLAGTPDAFPPSLGAQKFSDVTFLLPNYRVDFWCRQNNISQFVKDGIVGATPVTLFQGYGNWFLGLDFNFVLTYNRVFGGSTTNTTQIFIDVKPEISNLLWNAAVPLVGRIGGLADILGDVLSGYLQGMLGARWNIPLDVNNILHFWFKMIAPEGPDVTSDEFPNTSPWQQLETKYPWQVTMPDYLAIYIGCVGPDPINDCKNKSITGSLDLTTLLQAFGGGFLAPPVGVSAADAEKILPPKPRVDVVLPNGEICDSEKKPVCLLGYEEAKTLFGGENSYLSVVYAGVKKLSWKKSYSSWKIPYNLENYSGHMRLDLGVFLDGENEISFFAIDENNIGWEDIVKVRFVLDRVEPEIKVKGGEFDEKLQGYVFHSDKVQVLNIDVKDNVTPESNIKVSWSVDDVDVQGEWQKGVKQITLNLPKGIYKLKIKAQDEAGNEGVWAGVMYVKGDEVMGCPVIGSVTESDVSKMFALMNAMIPVSVILVAFYFMKAFRRNGNGKNGNGISENGKNEK
jgi:hypothetical protein